MTTKNGENHLLLAYADAQFKKIGLMYEDSLKPIYEAHNKNVNNIQVKEDNTEQQQPKT